MPPGGAENGRAGRDTRLRARVRECGMSTSVELGKIVKSDSHVRYVCQIFGEGEVAAPPRPVDFAFGSFVRVPLRADELAPSATLRAPEAADVAALEHVGAGIADALAPKDADARAWAIGVIFDTILVNPAFGTLGPRLSNDTQVALFSPDYLSERAVLVSIMLLGTLSATNPAHGVSGVNGTGGAGPHGGRIDPVALTRPRRGGGAATPAYVVRHGVPEVAPDLGAVVTTLSETDLRAFHHFADGGAPGGSATYLHMGYLPHIIAQDHPLLPIVALQIIERLERAFPANTALLAIVKRNFAWRLKVQTAG